ncbi:MAG: hypothetical protein JW891_11340 [Candidatus Lokiarchaeota archaeon]|nr:hypothetical protein [Candidatus Lokiarchaeota archaeon]
MNMSSELLETEKIVFDMIRDLLSEKQIFDSKKFVSLIISKFANLSINMNKEGIKQILYSLISKNMIIEGSALSIDDVLTNENRKNIYDHLCLNPGKYVAQLMNDLKLSHHVVVWHLAILRKFNFIEKQSFDNHVLYYDSRMDFSDVKKSYLISKNKKILDYLKQNNIGVIKSQISSDLKMHLTTLDRKLELLVEHGLIAKEYIDNSYLFFCSKQ